MNIEFRKFISGDLPLFRKWLSEPHVKLFWQETDDDKKLRDKIINKYPEMGIEAFMVYLDQQPIGFIQSYEACRVGGGWWPEAMPGVYGVDQFIGEPSFCGKGWGPKIMSQYVQKMKSENKITEIIVDPEPQNQRAILAYKKAGFQPKGVIETPNGKAYLMSLEILKN